MADLLFEREGRYLSLRGPYINSLGLRPHHHSVAPDFIKNRLLRDGEEKGHHVTVVNHLEIAAKLPAVISDENANKERVPSKREQQKMFGRMQRKLLDSILSQFGDPSGWERPIDLGLGISETKNAKAYYRVIHWPLGQVIRDFVGLGRANFHITVGFAPHDVHQYKGPGTLLCLQEGQHCVKELYSRLIEYVPFYFQDVHFTKALFLTGLRHGYYMEVVHLSTTLLQCNTH